MAEGQILFDAVNVRGSEERSLSQRPATFGIFALKQMAFACASEQDLSGSGYLETFGHRFSGLNTSWASHIFVSVNCLSRVAQVGKSLRTSGLTTLTQAHRRPSLPQNA